jgi:hypothetical protein
MSDFLLFTLQPNINLDPNRSLPGTHVDYPHHVHDAIAVDKKRSIWLPVCRAVAIGAPRPAVPCGVSPPGPCQAPTFTTPRPSTKKMSIWLSVCRAVASGEFGTAVPGGVSPTGPCQTPTSTTHITFTTPLPSTKNTSIWLSVCRAVAIGCPGWPTPGPVSVLGPVQVLDISNVELCLLLGVLLGLGSCSKDVKWSRRDSSKNGRLQGVSKRQHVLAVAVARTRGRHTSHEKVILALHLRWCFDPSQNRTNHLRRGNG